MPSTFTLIASHTIPSATSAYTFSDIPSTYTDLKLVWSVLQTVNTDAILTFNGNTSGYNYRSIFDVNQTSGAPDTYGGNVTTGLILQYFWGSGTTFNAGGMYITNYASATPKAIWTDNTQPNLTANNNFSLVPMSHNWSNTAAITSLTFTPGGGNLAANTQFSLYGIKNS
jgi:hypothetical protein